MEIAKANNTTVTAFDDGNQIVRIDATGAVTNGDRQVETTTARADVAPAPAPAVAPVQTPAVGTSGQSPAAQPTPAPRPSRTELPRTASQLGLIQLLSGLSLAVGLCLGVWWAAVMVEARIVAGMPVPDPPAATTAVPAPMASPTTGSWVAKLDVPSVRLSATVLEGTDDATLDRGAGHIEDTPFPGQPGNIGIAGHRDTTFRPVRHLRTGDPLELTTRDRVYRYLITKTFIVDPKDVYVLDPDRRSAHVDARHLLSL